MVKKALKGTAKKRKKRGNSWQDDVVVHTSLPPQVEGQVRCYLKLAVNQILWSVPLPPEVTHVRAQWWGEPSDGTIFRPVDVKKGGKSSSKTTARYPIRAGPKQFAAYLSDMQNLVLEVLSGPGDQMVTVGQVNINNIGLLAPNRPINGFFPVYSVDDEKIGELQVSLVLESLMASYDSLSPMPTPDMSLDMYSSAADSQPVNRPNVVPIPPPRPTYSYVDDPFISPGPKTSQSRLNGPVPQGVDSHLYGIPSLALRDSVQSKRSTVPSHTPAETVTEDSGTANQQINTLKGMGTLDSIQSLPRDSGSWEWPRKETQPAVIAGQSGSGTYRKTAAYLSHELARESAESKTLSTSFAGPTTETTKSSGPASLPGDVVSALLERGNKLRQAMIISTLDPQPKSSLSYTGETSNTVHSSDTTETPRKISREGSTGDLFREILLESSEKRRMHAKDVPDLQPISYLSDLSDAEGRAVDLVVGHDVTQSQLQLLKSMGGGSPASSVSGDDIMSDPGDPLHDDDIIQELFYKTQASEESDISMSVDDDMEDIVINARPRSPESLASLDDPGNRRPPSRHSSCSSVDREPVRDTDKQRTPRKSRQLKKKKSRTRSRSRSSSRNRTQDSMKDRSMSKISDMSKVSFDPSEAEDLSVGSKKTREPTVDGLSVERLTLLGRVHVARVMIDKLTLEHLERETTPTKSRTKARGRLPPKPARKASTYFVEYQFPVVAGSKDKYGPNTMATEVMRVASKKVSNGEITFSHRSVFPVLFDGDAIEKWWKSALVFKVYMRSPGQKLPRLLGMCSLTLKSVLKSEALFLDRHLDVKDRSDGSQQSPMSTPRRSRKDGNWPSVGLLRVNVELASDSREFSTALAKTRLAEMSHAKIVPIPAPKPKSQLLILNPGDSDKKKGELLSSAGTQTEPRSTDIDDLPLVPPPDPRPYQHLMPPHKPPQPPGSQGQTIPGTKHQQTIHSGIYHDSAALQLPTDTFEALTLHTLLMVPEGQNITLQGMPSIRHGTKNPSQPPKPLTGWTGRDISTRNLYLVCRMFWCDDVSRSNICWGDINPQFNFVQVAPVLLTASLLERLRNNFMVIEVWDKKTSSENDQLVGIVKLPLHQFYMSYRDRKIAASLLRSQYPVVSVDADLPVMNPFSGTQFGILKVLLGMGSSEQVSSLQRLKLNPGSAVAVPERPSHYLERQDIYIDGRNPQDYRNVDNLVEHIFEVSLEGLRGLKLLENMIWGEADCFVQYHFPVQTTTKQQGGPNIVHATPTLKAFRTATTLCVPDPVFNDVLRHRITMPEGSPVQREILTACAGAGGGVGGVPFEVWCRYYHPNVRDQVIAKAMLPLAKLCGMVTMQKRGEPSVQTFSLSLTNICSDLNGTDSEQASKVLESGLLDVTINYKTHVVKSQPEVNPLAVSRSLQGAQVCISVGVLRASGLKAAASALARVDAGMQYASEVGVNAYIKATLSFLQKQDERLTRTVARSFAPEFSYHMDFPCPLLWTEPDSDALSLAELLENSEARFELWHQVPTTTLDLDHDYVSTGTSELSGRRLVTHGGDVLLGTAAVPLIHLLTHKTGVSGWYPISLPSIGWESQNSHGDNQVDNSQHDQFVLDRVVGGLELLVKFAHQEDLERVVHAGRGVGWAPEFSIEHRDWESADESLGHCHQVTVAIDVASFPLQNALLTGQSKLDRVPHCYIRYKFYDKKAVCSRLCPVEESENGNLSVNLDHMKTLVIPASSPFSWYLHEERLEVQVWLTHQAAESPHPRPRHRDKLIGSSYLALHSLVDSRRRQHRLSGVYPLFKPGAASLGGACIRAHITLRPHSGRFTDQSEEDSDVEIDQSRSRRQASGLQQKKKDNSPGNRSKEDTAPAYTVDLANTFPVHICIERALHMPVITDRASGTSSAPSCYVSYQTADCSEPTCTSVFPSSEDPVWNHEHETRLDNDHLIQINKNLVLKVWHKPTNVSEKPDKSTDKVLGFVSVDLAPLVSGFQQLAGWYNIMDFNGQCQGQIKVSITPQELLLASKGTTSMSNQESTMTSSIYRTIATYPQFPSHLCRYSEQQISLGTAPASLQSFAQHFDNVKVFDGNLQQHQPGPTNVPLESRSLLFSALRSNLQDLDNITERLKQRMTPTSLSSTAPAGMQTVIPNRELGSTGSDDLVTNLLPAHPQNSVGDLDEPSASLGLSDLNVTHTLSGSTFTESNRPGYVTQAVHSAVGHLFGSSQHSASLPACGTLNSHAGQFLPPDASHLNHQDIQHNQNNNSYQTQTVFSNLPWQHDYNDQHANHNDTSQQAGNDCEIMYSDSDGEIVVPRPLNDVSSAFFSNSPGYQAGSSNVNLPQDDSWFCNPSNALDISSLSHSKLAVDPNVKQEESIFPKLSEHGQSKQKDEPDSWLSGVSELDRKDDYANLSVEELDSREVSAPNELSSSPLHEQYTGNCSDSEQDILGKEDPIQTSQVSRTSYDSGSKFRPWKTGRKAAMFRKNYERHRRGSSSSEDEGHARKSSSTSEEDTQTHKRKHRRTNRSKSKKNEQQHSSGSGSEDDKNTLLKHVALEDSEFGTGNLSELGSIQKGTDTLLVQTVSENSQPSLPPVDHSSDDSSCQESPRYTEETNKYMYTSSKQSPENTLGDEEEYCPSEDEFSEEVAPGSQGDKSDQGSVDPERWSSEQDEGQTRQQRTETVKNSISHIHDTTRDVTSAVGAVGQIEQPASAGSGMPNFFLPSGDLEQNMRALRLAVKPQDGSGQVSHDYLQQLASRKTTASTSRNAPSSQESQRIAKIFAARFSS